MKISKKLELPAAIRNQNLVLVGPRAAGKSKSARHLSKRYDLEALATDTLVRYENQGLTIARLIENSGGDWRAFRELEFKILQKIVGIDRAVIDTGGGILVDLDAAGNEELSRRKLDIVKQLGFVVYLSAEPDWLWTKVKADDSRPALSAHTDFQTIVARRHPWYQAAADCQIDTTGLRGGEIADRITKILNKL